MTTQFFIPLSRVPTITHQQQAVRVVRGKPVFYEPAKLKEARATLEAHLANHAPPIPYTSGVSLMVKWCFKTTAKHRNGEYRITPPDCDNLQKLLKDCMTAVGFWKDDALVASEMVEKFWADLPGIYIRIDPLEVMSIG